MTSPATPPKFDDHDAALALLRWYVAMGADEAIAVEPANRFAPAPAVAAPMPPAAPVMRAVLPTKLITLAPPWGHGPASAATCRAFTAEAAVSARAAHRGRLSDRRQRQL